MERARLAEALVKAPHGGAIAAWGSSALTTPQTQAQLDAGATAPRLGDAIRAAKLRVADAETRQSWILFGDPTLRIR